MVPTLSKVASYTPDHLVDSSRFWGTSQEKWGDITGRNATLMANLGWEGHAGEAAIVHTRKIQMTAMATQDVAVAAVGTVDMQAATLYALKGTAMDAVQAAQADGFEVSEGYGITDKTPASPQLQQARQAQAKAHQQAIVSAVQALQAHDQAVAGQIKAHHGELQMVTFGTDKGPVCNDPDYNSGIERRFWASVVGGAIAGGLWTGIPSGGTAWLPGALGGAITGGIGDLIHEATGDGPKCE